MATDETQLNKKKLFFNQLLALDEASDGEDDTNDARDVLRESKHLSSPPLTELTPERARTPSNPRKALGARRTSTQASDASFVEETPLNIGKSSTHHPESAGPAETTDARDVPRPSLDATRRTVSNPTLGAGSLVLGYSTGIKSMLKKRNRAGSETLNRKKKPRKEPSIVLVPENEQLFRDCVFYYIPPDDKAPLRRARINRARAFGATWTRELTPNTTHIVVDRAITFQDVMKFLKLETPPRGVTLVSEDYPIDSINSRFLIDPAQKRYALEGYQEVTEREKSPHAASQASNTSLKVKPSRLNPEVEGSRYANDTPPRPEGFTQMDNREESAPEGFIEQAFGGGLDYNTIHNSTAIPETPHEITPETTTHGAHKAVWPGDELDEMIKVARNVADVPIDEEEDRDDDRPPSQNNDSEESGSGDDARRPPVRSKRKGTKGASFNQQSFSCMTGGTGVTTESNPNVQTIKVLQRMADYYGEIGDLWRQISYRKAIGTLRKQSAKITTYEEAVHLPTIGHRLALKIEEVAHTNGLRRLNDAMSDPHYHTLQIFTRVYGVGFSQGWKWVQQGHKSLEDLKAHVNLTENQQLGIEHYEEFLTRIPRDEVTALGNVVKAAAATLDPDVEIIISGSYRRGASSSGDIDCMITKPSTTCSQDMLEFLNKLTTQLTESGFLVAALSVPSRTGSKWHGCCVLPGSPKPIWRRIDLLLVPETQLGAALIYFTGDDLFNRSIRLLASKKGWRLNQRGLYKDVMRGSGRVKLNEGSLIEGADEKKIFAALGVPWRPPEQRICH